jgi:hypothetical protein
VDIQFVEPAEIPVPPEEVRIRDLEARSYGDGRRIAVRIELTPFQQRPSLEISALDGEDVRWSETSVIEAIDNHLELTLHLPPAFHSEEGRIRVEVGYRDQAPVDVAETAIAID